MHSEPRVLLVGLGPTTLTALEGLAERFDVVALVRPPGPSGAAGDDTIQRAMGLGVPVETETAPAALETLVARLEPDAVVVSSYDRILPARLLEHRPFVNVHYAPLPRYRGRASVNWAILNGEPSTAISIHSLVPGLDAGGILYQEAVPIGERTTVTQLYAQLNALQRDAIAGAVQRRLDGDEGSPQDESQATYGCTRVPADGEIDWARPTAEVDRLVRALTDPYPGAYTYLGARRLWVDRAEPVPDAPVFEGRVPGRVANRSKAQGWVDVLTGDGVVRLHRVRRDGEDPRPAAEVITSVKMTLGLRVSDLLALLAQ
jgi:methionyl-tRNA formyltransferase